jgi:alkylated DNA repair dioxygenase AlkB
MNAGFLLFIRVYIVIFWILKSYFDVNLFLIPATTLRVSAWTQQATVQKKLVSSPKNHAITLSSVLTQQKQHLNTELQHCWTPWDVLYRVGCYIDSTPNIDPDGRLCSLILVRLSKQYIALDNNKTTISYAQPNPLSFNEGRGRGVVNTTRSSDMILSSIVDCLISSDLSNIDAIVDGTKACVVLSRLYGNTPCTNRDIFVNPWIQFWTRNGTILAGRMQDYHLSGIQWAMDCFLASGTPSERRDILLPKVIQDAHRSLKLPFRIFPYGYYSDASASFNFDQITVSLISSEVTFHNDEIRTTGSDYRVIERRFTAWQGDIGVASFAYSGKSMKRQDWSPTVRQIRDYLESATGQYYDGCLLNLYPDGRSGMRYHNDPDQGILWDNDTAVVSIGATRRFAFRSTQPQNSSAQPSQKMPHNFVVMDGDVTYMFGNCQERFQHTVKNAESKNEAAPRISLVFKRTLNSHGNKWEH